MDQTFRLRSAEGAQVTLSYSYFLEKRVSRKPGRGGVEEGVGWGGGEVVRWGGRGGVGGVLKNILYGEAPPRGPTPYPFIYHFFFRKGTPFVYL